MMQTKNKPSHKPTICRSFSNILLRMIQLLSLHPDESGLPSLEQVEMKPILLQSLCPTPVGSRAAISGEKTHAMSDCKEITD